MNNIRRISLKALIEKLNELDSLREEIMSGIQDVLDEEQESYDNLPESLQYSDRGDKMQENIDSMQSVIDGLDCLDVLSWTDTLSEM